MGPFEQTNGHRILPNSCRLLSVVWESTTDFLPSKAPKISLILIPPFLFICCDFQSLGTDDKRARSFGNLHIWRSHPITTQLLPNLNSCPDPILGKSPPGETLSPRYIVNNKGKNNEIIHMELILMNQRAIYCHWGMLYDSASNRPRIFNLVSNISQCIYLDWMTISLSGQNSLYGNCAM